jgi:hypothetical protein
MSTVTMVAIAAMRLLWRLRRAMAASMDMSSPQGRTL